MKLRRYHIVGLEKLDTPLHSFMATGVEHAIVRADALFGDEFQFGETGYGRGPDGPVYIITHEDLLADRRLVREMMEDPFPFEIERPRTRRRR